jgi:membrane fusion protein, heavy metal efflux system
MLMGYGVGHQARDPVPCKVEIPQFNLEILGSIATICNRRIVPLFAMAPSAFDQESPLTGLWSPQKTFVALFAAFVIGVLVTLASPARAHEGHDHGAPPTPITTTIAPRVDASSAMFEVIAVLRDDKLTIFVDRFITNEPVTDATVEVDTPQGTLKATPGPDGTYAIPAPWANKGTTIDLIFTVTAGADIDVLTGTLKLLDQDPAAPTIVQNSWFVPSALAAGLRERIQQQDPALLLVAAGAFVLGLVVARVRNPSAVGSAVIAATLMVIAAMPQAARADSPQAKGVASIAAVDLAQRFPDGAVFVPKATQRILAVRTIMVKPEEHRRSVALAGRVIPDPSASGNVQTSATGRLQPLPAGFPRLGQRVKAGDVLAMVQPSVGAADVINQQQQARELDQQLALVQRRLERLRPIANVIARSQIEDAELEFKGLTERRANLDRARREPERLVAPVDGVIASASATPGQVVEVNAVIFQIVNPDRLWIEALTFDAIAGAQNATARLNDGRALKLDYQGTGFADRNQAIPIQFAVNESTRGLRMGQLLTVLAETEESRTGIAVPRTAVVRAGNGQSIVYEHANAERFIPREVRVEPLDAERVLVVSGLDPGKRIVTQGVELLNQIR